jgi:hypothetical protein
MRLSNKGARGWGSSSGAKCSSPGSREADGEGCEDFCVAQRGRRADLLSIMGGTKGGRRESGSEQRQRMLQPPSNLDWYYPGLAVTSHAKHKL